MKKKLLALTSILFITATVFNAFNANAQLVTISETHQLPVFGDTIHYVDANSFGFDPTGVGPVTAKVWDNSALLNAGTTYDFFYVDPATITGNGVDSFPFATIARGESGATGYFYYQNTTNNINRIGWFGSNSNFGIYENQTFATEFHFPITAGNTVTSSYNGRYAPFNLGEDSVKIEMGSLIINADMQGIMMLPTGTFNDVLRLHVLETFHIVTYLFGFPAQDNVITDDYFYWFSDTILQPILVSGVTSVDGNPQTPVLRYQPISTSTGIAENNIEIANLYPNPSSGIFNLTLKNNFAEKAELTVADVTGRIVFKETINEKSRKSNFIIDLGKNPDSVYFLRIKSANTNTTKKLLLNK
jgi:hypothetical protein